MNSIRDLKPDGRNTLVTEETKYEYVKLVCQMKMTGAIRQQLTAFLEGFYDIVPKKLISIFNEQELELLISGLPTIDIDDLKANTEYHKYQPTSLQVREMCTGLEVIKLFSSSAQLSMKFQLLINVKIVEISGKFRFSTLQLVIYPAHKC